MSKYERIRQDIKYVGQNIIAVGQNINYIGEYINDFGLNIKGLAEIMFLALIKILNVSIKILRFFSKY